MSTEQQRIYMDSLNNYRTVMAAKEYDYKRGEEKGRADEKLSNARNLKFLGVSTLIIAQATGLSIEDINKLKKNISLSKKNTSRQS